MLIFDVTTIPCNPTLTNPFVTGHAALTLRDDWRRHLKQAVHDMGLEGVRYHGLFDDDQGPVVSGPGVYNFTLLDSTWDFLVRACVCVCVKLPASPNALVGTDAGSNIRGWHSLTLPA